MGSQVLFHLLLVVSFTFLATEARPFNILKTGSSTTSINGFFDGLGIKNSGPSSGGQGHKAVNVQTLGGIKDSGPSPGAGHKYTNSNTLGGIKDSGPTPGTGHKFTNSKTLGGIKIFGQKFLTEVESLGGRKEGPSPGQGHSFVNGAHP